MHSHTHGTERHPHIEIERITEMNHFIRVGNAYDMSTRHENFTRLWECGRGTGNWLATVGGYQVERPKKLPSKMCLTLNVGRRERSTEWGSALKAAPAAAWGSASRRTRTKRTRQIRLTEFLSILLLLLPSLWFVLCAPTFWAAGDALGEHVFRVRGNRIGTTIKPTRGRSSESCKVRK